MFERFSEALRPVIALSLQSARRLKHAYIGTEHMLHALTLHDAYPLSELLATQDVTADAVQGRILEVIGEGEHEPSGHVPLTPRARQLLELSHRIVLGRGDSEIRPEHLLLGLLDQEESVAYSIITKLCVDADALRELISSHEESLQSRPSRREKLKRERDRLTEVKSTTEAQLARLADALQLSDEDLALLCPDCLQQKMREAGEGVRVCEGCGRAA